MDWSPITSEELNQVITDDLAQAEPDLLSFWNSVRVAPEKWALSPWGDLGDGFWVVAIGGNFCVWFNDVEDGFDISGFTDRGTINGYWCNQFELTHALHGLRRALDTGIHPGGCGPPEPLPA